MARWSGRRGRGVDAVLVAVLVVAAATSIAGGGTEPSPAADAAPPVLVVGHRGAAAVAPEHTGPSYDAAMRSGVDVLECDLQITADQQLVCLHDTTVDRTTGMAHLGPVEEYTLDQLREMDFGSWGEPKSPGAGIVTLEDQIECYRAIDPRLQLYVETKAPGDYDGRMEPLLVGLLVKLGVMPAGDPDVRRSPIIVQSFDLASLAAVRRLAPSLPLAFLTYAPGEPLPEDAPDVDVIAANDGVLQSQPEAIAAIHAAGREVHTWTVDDPARIRELIAQGVDGFFTNDPGTARPVVDDTGRGSGRTTLPPAEAGATDRPKACAAGLGVGLAARAQQGAPTSTTPGSVAPAAEDPEPAPGTDARTAVVAVAVGVLVAVGLYALFTRRRRGDADEDDQPPGDGQPEA